MKITRHAQERLGMRFVQHPRTGRSRQHLAQAKTAVRTVGGFGQIQACLLGLPDCVVAPADGAFEIAQQHIDPACALDFAGGTSSFGFQHGVRMAGISKAPEAEQAVAKNFGVRGQMMHRPVLDTVIVEAAHRFDDCTTWMLQRFIGL